MSYHAFMKNRLLGNGRTKLITHHRASRIPHHAPPRRNIFNESLDGVLRKERPLYEIKQVVNIKNRPFYCTKIAAAPETCGPA